MTDMLALTDSASVIRRAIRAMRRQKWTRKFARIDPEMVERVERLRKIQVTAFPYTGSVDRLKNCPVVVDARLVILYNSV